MFIDLCEADLSGGASNQRTKTHTGETEARNNTEDPPYALPFCWFFVQFGFGQNLCRRGEWGQTKGQTPVLIANSKRGCLTSGLTPLSSFATHLLNITTTLARQN